MDNPLARIPVITQAILDAQPLGFHMQKLDELQVLRLMADKIKANIELKNDIAEAQLIIYRNAGLRFGELFKPGGNGSNQHDKGATRTPVRLADYGINTRIADICRKLAVLPEYMFDSMIIEIRKSEHVTQQELTTSYFYKAAKIHIMRQRGISTDRPALDSTIAISTTDMARAAATIRRNMSVEQVAQLIDELVKGA